MGLSSSTTQTDDTVKCNADTQTEVETEVPLHIPTGVESTVEAGDYHILPTGEMVPVPTHEKILSTNETGPEVIMESLEEMQEEVLASKESGLGIMEIPFEEPMLEGDQGIAENPKKRTFCIFCNSLQSQLPRHLLRAHPEEDRIKKIADLPQRHPDRLEAIRKLRMEGHIMSKRKQPVRSGAISNYIKCSHCSLQYSKRNFYRHYRKCAGKRAPKNIIHIMENIETLKQKDPTKSLAHLLCDEMKTLILPKITSTAIMENITNDKEVIEFGNSLCLRFGNELKKHENLIRHKLRTVTKFKMQMAEKDTGIKNVIDVFDPERWNLFVNTIREFSKLEETELEKKSPSNVRHLGLLLSNLAKDVEVTCTDDSRIKTIKRWLKLYNRKYQSSIGWQGNKLAMQKKCKKKRFLPLAEDISKLNTHVRNILADSTEQLKTRFSYSAWTALNESVMILILCFNRKRVGEVMTVTLDDYKKKDKVKEGTEMWNALSASERNIASQYFHLQIRGKFSRPVPLLISNEVADAIELIIKYRIEAGVSDENPFLFAKRGDNTSKFDANVVLREVSEKCGAERPEDLRSRTLRTHIATVSQALNLSDTDLKILSEFLGHTTKTHLEHYRMPSDIEHTARVSKLLHALDTGTIHRYRGKTIDDIDYDEEIVEDISQEGYEDDPKERAGPSTTSIPDHRQIQVTPKKQKIPTPVKGTPSSTKSTTRKKRMKWIPDETKIMRNEFRENLKYNTLPSFQQCNDVRKRYPLLSRRKASVMKAWVHNQKKKKSKYNYDSD